MKKYIVSFFIVATFAVYVLYQKLNGINTNMYSSVIAGSTTSASAGNNPVASYVVPKSFSTTASASTKTSQPTMAAQSTPTPAATQKPAPTPAPVVTTANTGQYKNGQYTGISANAYYGNIQVAVTISGGAITDVQFLDYPQDRGTSVYINEQAMPILRQEAIQAQSANVDIVSGATDSSGAFRQSLSSALAQAANS